LILMGDTLGSALAEAGATLSAAGLDDPRRRARQLVAGCFGVTLTELLSQTERALDRPAVQRFRDSLFRMANGEPLSRILGWREFWGLRFALSADTLDPRPETETLVDAVIRRVDDRNAPLRILDLGTGTGCLLLALLYECPAAGGIGVDIAPGAVMTAKKNAASLNLGGRTQFLIGDWGSALSRPFSVVMANPPYIASGALAGLPLEVGHHDPRLALDGGEDGLAAYRRIAEDLPGLLVNGSVFVAEVGAGQAASVAEILKARGLLIDAIECDLAGIERCIIAQLDENRPAEVSPWRSKKPWNVPVSRLGWGGGEFDAL
jgi:release factor glutamine methyltransferase